MPVGPELELRERLKQLGVTQVGFADVVEVDGKTVRRWVHSGATGPVRRLLEVIEYHAGLRPMPDWLIRIVAKEK